MSQQTFQLPQSEFFEQITHIPVARRTYNLGDDIQSEAAANFWDVRNFVDRDMPETWPKNGLIPLVGWYGYGFFPAACDCLIVSFHAQMNSRKHFAEPRVRDWLANQVKQQGFPALCRDYSSRDFMRELKIEAEFCGCVTTTLKSENPIRFKRLAIDAPAPGSDWEILANEIPALPGMSAEMRVDEARKRIQLLDQAQEVVTSRLHIYLPCKALGVPVQLRMDLVKFQPERFSGHI